MLLNSLFKSSGNLSTLAYSFAKRDQRLWRTISQLIDTTNDRGPLWLIEVQFAEHLRFASVSCSPYLGLFSRLWPTFYPSSLTYYYVAITALSPSAATDPGRVCGTATEAVMVVCDMMCVVCLHEVSQGRAEYGPQEFQTHITWAPVWSFQCCSTHYYWKHIFP